jgi:S1-C subfamily serine protease
MPIDDPALAGARKSREAEFKVAGSVELKDLTKDDSDALGLDGPHGAKVAKPVPGGPAEKAGLLPGDALLFVDGVETGNGAAIAAAIGGKMPNAEVKLRVLRGGKEKRLAFHALIRPSSSPETAKQ